MFDASRITTATKMAQAVRNGETTATDLLEAHLARVDALNERINAVIWQDRDAARQAAKALDDEAARGQFRGPLHGVPMTIKESFDIAGAPSTWGIPEWRDNIAPRDSDAVRRLRAAGAVVYGKTNVPMKLMEWQSFNEIYGTTNNPWDVSRTPGGSSGGSGAALATGMAALEVGSDIGSSIRNPAHFNGVFGLKPTWNVVSMQGHNPPGWMADTDIGAGGPLARSARDLRLALDVLTGGDDFLNSAWSVALPADDRAELSQFRVALMLGDPASPVDNAYLDVLSDFADRLAAKGAQIEAAQPSVDNEAHFTLYLQLLGAAMSGGMSEAEVAANLDAVKALNDPHAWRLYGNRFGGMNMRHADWLVLDNERRKARQAFDAFFAEYDILLMPVASSAAFPHDQAGPRYGRKLQINGKAQPEPMQLFWSGYTGVVHLPSVVGPAGFVDHLPVGYQAAAGHGRDHTALAFAQAVEDALGGCTPPPCVAG
jgi:amidase